MKVRKTISWIKTKIQAELFPYLEEIFTDPITKRQKQLITTYTYTLAPAGNRLRVV